MVHIQCNENKGIIWNLSRAFSATPIDGNPEFACVLEDDNYYRPAHFENATEDLLKFHCNVYLCNAQISQYSDSGFEEIQDRYNLSPIYGDKKRKIEISERLRVFPNSSVISNSGLFWRLNDRVKFEIPHENHNQIVQERYRAICCEEEYLFNPKPNVVWTNFAERTLTKSSRVENQLWRRSEAVFNTHCIRLCKKHGVEFSPRSTWKHVFLNSFSIESVRYISSLKDMVQLLKNLALYTRYWKNIR